MSDLSTLADIRNRFPATPKGYRPSERFLREAVRQLGCYVQVGRTIYLTEEHWQQLLIGLQRRPHEKCEPSLALRASCATPSSPGEALQRALELSKLSREFENGSRSRRLPED